MRIGELAEELRRRRVFRVTLGYLVGAWIMVEVADVAFPRLGLPDWTVTLVLALVILGLPLTLILAWILQVTPEGIQRDASPVRKREDAQEIRSASIAVLPFVDMSEDGENEYFSDGMTEEILNALVRVRDLHVASRTSSFAFKRSVEDVREIAGKLSVATVLEGSVRKSGSRLRITAQLIDAQNGYHLWSDTYDRELEDVFTIQDEIARAIVDALKVELVGAEESGSLVHQTTGNVEAYELYLKGRFVFNRFTQPDLRQSLELYGRALDADPCYARAYAGIADSWMNLADDWMAPEIAYPEAQRAAERAVKLDDTLAEAHTALGKVLGWHAWDFDKAELALRRAVAANPNYADAHWGLGTILPANGQLEEGLQEVRTALSLDPLSPTFGRFTARFLLYLRRFDEAIEQARRTLEIDHRHVHARTHMGQAYLAMGEPERARDIFMESIELGDILSSRAFLAQALAALGRKDEARELLEELESGSGDGYVRDEFVAAAYAALGESDAAFAALDRGLAARSAGLIYLHVDPSYDPLRDDSRYDRLVQAVGLR
jgi:adenylate cyclase